MCSTYLNILDNEAIHKQKQKNSDDSWLQVILLTVHFRSPHMSKSEVVPNSMLMNC